MPNQASLLKNTQYSILLYPSMVHVGSWHVHELPKLLRGANGSCWGVYTVCISVPIFPRLLKPLFTPFTPPLFACYIPVYSFYIGR